MEINLNKIRSLLEKNLIDFKVRGYEYNEDGATDTVGENLKPEEELVSWIEDRIIEKEDLLIDEETGEVTEDPASPITTISLFDNNTNIRDALAQTIFDIFTDADSNGSNITTIGNFGGGNRSAGNGNPSIKVPAGKTFKITVDDTVYDFRQAGLYIDGQLVIGKPSPP